MTRDDTRRSQQGAALAVSLLMLVILTLIGIAAMRVGRLELRLSQNAESRVNAQQRAQSLADAVVNRSDMNLAIQAGTGVLSCLGSDIAPPSVSSDCVTAAPTLPGNTAIDYGYAKVTREQPEFVPAASVRDGTSGKTYDYARFTVVAGYDNTGNYMGAAEVGVGVLRLHVQPTGVTYQ